MTLPDHQPYRPLTEEEIHQLRAQGCTAEDWNTVRVTDPFLVERVVQVDFAGSVSIASLAGEVEQSAGRAQPAGLYRAHILDCVLGDGVRVANVLGWLAGYHLGPQTIIEDVGVLETRPGATFGAGVPVQAVNEAGGREVPLFNALSSQFAHLLCLYRYRRGLAARLVEMAKKAVDAHRRDHGVIGAAARVVGTAKVIDVDIGPAAVVDSVISLVNGTILSHPDAPTTVEDGVIAQHFVMAEGSHVSAGSLLSHTLVGQGCRVGKQFSAENCLMFANCEAFHGEACSVLAGPHTVTHHKSTLLIGGLFSFFNAGSATNQSNHRYKLGPTHEGKLERGCKTGSSSYLMWPCRVGPFSVVLGKHTRSFDTGDLPFSHLEADSRGRCELIPGHYIATVGTLRDGAKWPQRDRRNGPTKRDVICFDVFSPLTIGRMMRGERLLARLQETTDRSVESVAVSGVEIKRVLLRTGRKRYATYVERYLLEQITRRAESRYHDGARSLRDLLTADNVAVYSEQWADVGGQLMPMSRLDRLCDTVISGEVATVEHLRQACAQIRSDYDADVWLWVRRQAREAGLLDCDTATTNEVQACVNQFCQQQEKFLRLVLVDAQREFDETSQTGFGLDGDGEAAQHDFTAVRGRFEENSFVKQVMAEMEELPARCQRICHQLASLE